MEVCRNKFVSGSPCNLLRSSKMSGSCLCLGVSGVSGVHCIGDSELELVTAQSSSEPEDHGGVEADDQSGSLEIPILSLELALLDQSEALLRSRVDQSEAGLRGQSAGGDQDRSRDLTRDT